MLKVSLLSACNFPKVELLSCYIAPQSIWYCIFPADGIMYSHNWWGWLQVCGHPTRQTGMSNMWGCGPQSPPDDMLWKGLLQSLPGWTQETLQHLSKLQADRTKLPWHQRWVNSKTVTAVAWGVYSGNDFIPSYSTVVLYILCNGFLYTWF